MSGLRDIFVTQTAPRGDFRLHGLGNADPRGGGFRSIPLVLVPGLWGTAEQFSGILERLRPRPAYALSLRARGRSEEPESGYRLADHASDLRAFVDHLGLERFALASVSAGAAYAIAFAASCPERIERLSLVDYPPLARRYPPEMVAGVLQNVPGLRLSERALRSIQRESEQVELAGDLAKLRCPVRVLRGARPGSYLDDAGVAAYRAAVASLEVLPLPSVAHDPLETEAGSAELLAALS